ncbi:uncharacterized protein E2C01_020386 [Portunus trituberculatus]|uniref:CDAN1-interacting nuclease 1 n=1 Tax=Portunus trituberculatus TaxID=210409 RepID=A0A5B7DZZ0_PORTR|nr:uncharacterized protein [Portunus trituberculatus]
MKLQQYTEIQKTINDIYSNGEGNVVIALNKKFPEYVQRMVVCIKKTTLGSICTQEIQRKVKKRYHRLNTPEKTQEIFMSYTTQVEDGEAPGVLVRMAQELDYSPAMLAKLVLEHHLKTTCPDVNINKSQINSLLRDTTLIDDRDLSYEVYLLILASPCSSIGQEYEFLLRQELDKLNIVYHDEDELRSRGYDKTPDIKLDIPIAGINLAPAMLLPTTPLNKPVVVTSALVLAITVSVASSAVDGHVINWIESKASFGDEESHRSYLKDQFWSYWNR